MRKYTPIAIGAVALLGLTAVATESQADYLESFAITAKDDIFEATVGANYPNGGSVTPETEEGETVLGRTLDVTWNSTSASVKECDLSNLSCSFPMFIDLSEDAISAEAENFEIVLTGKAHVNRYTYYADQAGNALSSAQLSERAEKLVSLFPEEFEYLEGNTNSSMKAHQVWGSFAFVSLQGSGRLDEHIASGAIDPPRVMTSGSMMIDRAPLSIGEFRNVGAYPGFRTFEPVKAVNPSIYYGYFGGHEDGIQIGDFGNYAIYGISDPDEDAEMYQLPSELIEISDKEWTEYSWNIVVEADLIYTVDGVKTKHKIYLHN